VLLAVVLLSGFAFVRGCSGTRGRSRPRQRAADFVSRMSAEGAWQLQNIREVRSKRVVRGIRIDGARGDEQLDVEVDYPPR